MFPFYPLRDITLMAFKTTLNQSQVQQQELERRSPESLTNSPLGPLASDASQWAA